MIVADAALRTRLHDLFGAAVAAVSPAACMPEALPPAPPGGRRAIIAVGKAAAEMMRVAEQRAGAPVCGLVVTRHGHLPPGWPVPGSAVEVIEAGHPVPDVASARAAERALAIARTLGPGDELLVFLSGGGSALLAAPVAGVTLADKQRTTRALLRSGATIAEMNCVRKHLSAVKGGRLAVAAGGARVLTWIISDIPGDDLSFIASGPTLADRTTLENARAIVARYVLDVPDSVHRALADPANETPPASAPGLMDASVVLLARARDALDSSAAMAAALGYAVLDLGDALEGEARRLGAEQGALARQLAAGGAATAILSGGETSVTVINPEGRGGRNLEYLLGLAIALDGHPGIAAIACDTDGIDGTEDVAGAIVTPDTLARARAAGIDPAALLAANDAYVFFATLGDLVRTGPTLTHVNDFRAILIG